MSHIPSNDEEDMFNSSNEIEANSIPKPDIAEGAQPKLHRSQCETSDSYDNASGARDILGHSSTSVEELELSCNNMSKIQSWSAQKLHTPQDTTSSSLADSSCIILDDSSTKGNISEIVLGDSESQEEDAEYEKTASKFA